MKKDNQRGRSEYWALRDRLRQEDRPQGPRSDWQSLEELTESPELQGYLEREFPHNIEQWSDAVGRRRFLQLMGASLASAGVSGCTKQPNETIVPFVRQPENLIPGRPVYFATAAVLGGRARGVLVESHMGRPTKLEGNPLHPASLGAGDVLTQACILDLYDPDRSQNVINAGRIRTWDAFASVFTAALERHRQDGGSGLRVLSETVCSPTQGDILRRAQDEFPDMRLHQYEPINRDGLFRACRDLFGFPLDVRYDLRQADVIVSLDADFLSTGPASLVHARQTAAGRPGATASTPNRIYVAESDHSLSGAYADHRLALSSGRILGLAQALAAGLGLRSSAPEVSEEARLWLKAVVEDLQAHPGRAVVIAGDRQPSSVHALALLINQRLGHFGVTVELSDPIDEFPVDQAQSLRELTDDMKAGLVQTLIVLGGNPVYDAPVDLEFEKALDKVPLRIRLGLHEDETSLLCHWHLPATHFLETWSDARAFDGTATIQQPLIAPLYGTAVSALQVLSFLSGDEGATDYELVREFWQQSRTDGFEDFWRRSVHDGLVEGTRFAARVVSVSADAAAAQGASAGAETGEGLELSFQPDPTVYDGRFANNPWLQETPKGLSKLTWDNALFLSPKTARQIAGESPSLPDQGGSGQWPLNREMVRLDYRGRSLEAAVWVLPGHADDCATLTLGYGRRRSGRIGQGPGFNAYSLRTSDAPSFSRGLKITRLGRQYPLACVQEHHRLEGRNHIRVLDLEQLQDDPDAVSRLEHFPPGQLPSLYPETRYDGAAWGLNIDLNACTGCNACVTACQAENNIAVVGKDQVLRGREMHWIRVDRYFRGDIDRPQAHHQPLPCQHCEHAPCEPVCPVGATVHSDEGLNDMVYNRCVGTRYCANNCPYKVRRFNFYLYSDLKTPTRKMQYNPDVTVRTRGVMEKCTYCIQRISAARIASKREDREIRDGEIVTACQQVCPTRAIVFGDINQEKGRLAQRRRSRRHYAVLRELGTRPRTTYLARLRNPHPDLKALAPDEGGT